ncbi:MAG TPA: MBL fold metallo-hydrolase [Candidatus Saccharimonadales bacterium]|nr:MBL fold metallo-hydrolase [Candidatus Saccharimonadales bacterium]
MELQFYGANCLSVVHKGTRIIIDDNLAELGGKSITRESDVALFSGPNSANSKAKRVFDGPGEYEVGDISIIGINTRLHVDENGKHGATMFKLVAGEMSVLITGHIYPSLNDDQLETISVVDLLIVPVGGNGFTVDPVGALKLIKDIDPKLVVPTHFADKSLKFPVPQQELAHALKEMSMEPKEKVSKLRLKPSELSDVTQLIILEKS